MTKLTWKRPLLVGAFLGGLCAVLAAAIAGGDLLTKDVIAKNKAQTEKDGLARVFRDATFSEAIAISSPEYPELSKYWTVDLGDEGTGYVYSAAGKNAYGDIALLAGFYADASLANVIVITNTQTYGQTLEDEYLDPLSKAEDKEAALDHVKCGATYGAKLTRDLVNEARNYLTEVTFGGGHE